MMRKILNTLLMLTFIFSCGVEEFSAKKQKNTIQTTNIATNSIDQCSESRLVRPKVDLLFIWDNSTSTNFITPDIKTALTNTVNEISKEFDFHVLLAPLIASGNQSTFFFSKNGHQPGSGISVIDKSHAANALGQFPPGLANAESGAQRARDLLRTNISNGVFRQNANHIVIIMSNDDDISFQTGNYPISPGPYISNRKYDLLCIRGNYSGARPSGYTGPFGNNCSGASSLNSSGMRFISIVAENAAKCSSSSISQYKLNQVYKTLSSQIYTAPYSNANPLPTDQNAEATPDVYDICDNQGVHIFDGINNSIKATTVGHVYRYWPIASTGQTVDPTTIQVTMSSGQSFSALPSSLFIVRDLNGKNDTANGNPISGWRFLNGNQSALNTRFLPDLGEPYTGKVIELFGDAKVSYPLCLKVTSNATKEYFGYVHLASKPIKSSIALRINGTVIPESLTNGWKLIESGGQAQFINNKNIKVISPTNDAQAFPADPKSGYFLKVYGSAVYSNGATVDAQYSPAGN